MKSCTEIEADILGLRKRHKELEKEIDDVDIEVDCAWLAKDEDRYRAFRERQVQLKKAIDDNEWQQRLRVSDWQIRHIEHRHDDTVNTQKESKSLRERGYVRSVWDANRRRA